MILDDRIMGGHIKAVRGSVNVRTRPVRHPPHAFAIGMA
jgi:hypothetical protein